MADNIVGPLVHAEFALKKAQSACCGEKLNPAPGEPSSTCCSAPLNAAAVEAPHDFECQGCGQPAEPYFECQGCGQLTPRVLGAPVEVHAYSDGHPALAAQQGGA